ncbi:MAG: phosphoenolpyruvate carboxykinase (GTP) [Candidatus Omnitrophica bacterium]|nr:phosphoenolpyruvate carboxykinase (GTP) [Candidatus Omnitrophota bacterium]
MQSQDMLKNKMDAENYGKLRDLKNPKVLEFVSEYAALMEPDKIFVRTDSEEDRKYIRERTLALGEEKALAVNGHTVHFDGYRDQARDKKNTRYLMPKGAKISYYVNTVERESGIREIGEILRGIMCGKEMFVCFFCLGPADSPFSLYAVQITDSSYVAHSEDILYRAGYEQFRNNPGTDQFFRFVHSAGVLENGVSKNVDQRRVYIDLENELVYSANTQYAGNTVGLKKLALRLAIQKASREGWLAEHMFLMSISDLDGEKAYFSGAYPSMCGKTSTAMLPGETIVGDDIAYLRVRDGEVRGVNVERGIFGIIKDVNADDDPILYKALTSEGERIFSNVLVDPEGTPYWMGKPGEMPHKGENFYGQWFPGKADEQGQEIPPSHKNARYTIRLKDLENVDENLENPDGVKVSGLIYGGRDSDTWVPVEQALSWEQGICIKAASLESETTAATLGQEGVRVFNPMSNMDFLSVSLGKYVKMNLEFGGKPDQAPMIFSVNYFLRDKEGRFLNAIHDKRVWLKWVRLRSSGKADAILTPTGYIPLYEDLKKLFQQVLKKEFSRDDYRRQFSLRVKENLAKIERIRNIYVNLKDIPARFFQELDAQEQRLQDCLRQHGELVAPEEFLKK